MSDTANWIMVGGTVVTALATAGLVIFAAVQLKSLRSSVEESTKTRSAQVLLDIYRILNDLRPMWHELYKLPDNFNT